MLASSKEYHQYLKNIKWIGKLYRSLFLHPMLQKIVGKEFLDVGCGIGDFLERGNENSLGLDTNNYNIIYLNSRGKAKGKTIKEGEKSFINSDMVMKNGILLGCHNSLDFDDLEYICYHFQRFIEVN